MKEYERGYADASFRRQVKIYALTAEVEAIKKTHEQYRKDAIAYTRKADKQISSLRSALEKYGWHLPYENPRTFKHQSGCMVLCEEDLSGVCDCGFEQALKESEVKE